MGDHRKLTEMAWATLPDEDRALWRDHAEDVIGDYCGWPDKWFGPDRHEQIDPYQLVIEGVQFHYPPMSHPDYLYWGVERTDNGPRMKPLLQSDNANWRFFEQGMRHYLEAITADVAAGRTADAAKRLGILLHFFQDTHVLHALEGPWGTDCFVLDRLLDLPADGPRHVTSLGLLSQSLRTEGDITGHAPQLEGTSIDEAVFRLYQRYIRSASANRRLHIPLVQAALADDEPSLDALYRDMHERLARLSADLVHTVSRLATDEFGPAEAQRLETVHLDEFEPIHRPWIVPGPYRFSAIVPGACLDSTAHKHPLRLRQPDGRIEQFERGWGGGAHIAPLPIVHELPAGVYQRLQGHVGLHAELGEGGCVQVAIELGSETLARQQLDDATPTLSVDAPADVGGALHLTAWRDPDATAPATANLAWADWRLIK